jgi:hypothetical protein
VEPSMGPISVKPEINTCDNLCFVVHEDRFYFTLFFSIKLNQIKLKPKPTIHEVIMGKNSLEKS